jgi:hypothetical protein
MRRNGDDPRDGSISIGHCHLGSRFDRAEMLRQAILQVGDLDSFHG